MRYRHLMANWAISCVRSRRRQCIEDSEAYKSIGTHGAYHYASDAEQRHHNTVDTNLHDI